MAWMEQLSEDFSFSVPVKTAKAVEKDCPSPISLEALGLLTNLLSFSGRWKLNKTELYKRYAKAAERAVKSAWNSLTDANYIIEFRYRSGRKWEHVYYYRKTPFTPEEKAQILAKAEFDHGEIWGLQNADLKMETSKSRGNQRSLLNKTSLLNKKIKDDDDIAKPSLTEEEESLITYLRQETNDEMTDRSFNAVVKKVVDKHSQGKIREGKFRDYLVTSISNKIEDLELRRMKDKANETIKAAKHKRWEQKQKEWNETSIKTPPVFYNWLEQ